SRPTSRSGRAPVRLDRLRLKNWCQFRDLELTFGDGLNALIGPNGSGKSNALKAAFAALTGDFSRNDGKNADNVCDLAGPDDPSEIELDLTHAGKRINLVRKLRPVGRQLRIDGGRAHTGDKDVSQRVFDLLGVTPEIVAQYVMVDQWEVFSVFALSPQKRAE